MIDIKVNGYKAQWNENMPLLTRGLSNNKIAKSEHFQGGTYSTMILHLAPANLSGFNVCPMASKQCKKICLNMSGQGGMVINGELHKNSIHIARVGRTTLLMTNKSLFFKKIKNEIDNFLIECEIKGSKPCVRLNGTSDLNWGKMTDPNTNKTLMEIFPQVQFYDYTKVFNYLNHKHKNYFLIFSRSESNEKDVIKALKKGVNVAVVFGSKTEIPNTFMGHNTYIGDTHDLRFLDNELANSSKPLIVALIEKGYLAKRELNSGFIIRDIQKVA